MRLKITANTLFYKTKQRTDNNLNDYRPFTFSERDMNFYHKIPIRTRIAFLTILVWLAVPYAYIQYLNDKPDYLSFCLRGGLVMFVFWLAWPEVEKLPKWLFLVLPLATVIAIWRPQLLLLAIPFYLAFKVFNFIVFNIFAPLPTDKNESRDHQNEKSPKAEKNSPKR